MKKYKLTLSVFILSFILLGSFGFNVNFARAYDSGCIGSSLYNITTGQYCGASQYGYSNYNYDSYGCTSTGPYNTITGQPCSGSQYGYSNSNYIYGCTSDGPFNIYTGQLCPGATSQYSYPNTYPYVYPYNNTFPYVNSNILPFISSVSTSSGRVGTQVTIYGRGFNNTYSSNTINFGLSIIPNVYSPDGTSMTFSVPAYTNSACLYTVPACVIPQYQIIPGTYPVFVTNINGTSNVISFLVNY